MWARQASYNRQPMSQITRCPYCATTFKVVKDQLRISDGWVRCGQCKEVFNAHEHMVQLEPAPLLPPLPLDELQPPLRPAPVSQAPRTAQVWSSARANRAVADGAGDVLLPSPEPSFLAAQPPTAAPPQSSVELAEGAPDSRGYELPGALQPDGEWLPEPDAAMPRDAASTQPEQDEPEQDEPEHPIEDVTVELAQPQSGRANAQEAQVAEDAPFAPAKAPADMPAEVPVEVPVEVPQEADAAVGDRDHAEEQTETGLQVEPEFVKAARRNAFWRMPVVRGVLALVTVVLLMGLALQIAVHNRNLIASQHPAARGWLASLCEPLQCTLQAPRHIAAVVIDSSSFLKARNDPAAYQLQMSVKNTSSLTVAMPALELTLTDAQDQPILRRVLQGDELAAPAELAPGFVWNGAVSLQVTQGAAQVAGYRLLAFYP